MEDRKFLSAKAQDRLQLTLIQPEFFRSLLTDKPARFPLADEDEADSPVLYVRAPQVNIAVRTIE